MAKEDKIVFCTGGGCTAKLRASLYALVENCPERI